jgi:hypothetical protein
VPTSDLMPTGALVPRVSSVSPGASVNSSFKGVMFFSCAAGPAPLFTCCWPAMLACLMNVADLGTLIPARASKVVRHCD